MDDSHDQGVPCECLLMEDLIPWGLIEHKILFWWSEGDVMIAQLSSHYRCHFDYLCYFLLNLISLMTFYKNILNRFNNKYG